MDIATDSLDAARLLADQGYFGFAASRTYYAMFYTAEALLLVRGFSFPSHAAIIANYGKEYSKTKDMDRKFREQPKSKEFGLPVSPWAIPTPQALSVRAAPALL